LRFQKTLQLPVVSNLPDNFRPCGECQKCCEGWVAGTAFGIPFSPHKPCAFLQGKCLVYNFRPHVCKKFYCAWTQGLFPEWMRPDKTKLLISVQDWSKGQYLKVIECDSPMTDDCKKEIFSFSQAQKCPLIFHYADKKTEIFGPSDFVKEVSQ
jgi:hypothetical protein